MEILVVYVIFSAIVAVAARHRGRGDIGWFILSMLISPLLALIALFVIPSRVENRPKSNRYMGTVTSTERMPPKAFVPDGVLSGIPYKVREDGKIDALMQGATVRFDTFDKFTEMTSSPT